MKKRQINDTKLSAGEIRRLTKDYVKNVASHSILRDMIIHLTESLSKEEMSVFISNLIDKNGTNLAYSLFVDFQIRSKVKNDPTFWEWLNDAL